MTDLKRVLMEVGNMLVIHHGFSPALPVRTHVPEYEETTPLRCITEFFNAHPEARALLKERGFDWSM